MSVLCRTLIATVVAAHMTMGCCWHHAHACEGSLSLTHDGATHGGQSPASGSDHSHHGANDCQGGRCFFVSSGPTVGGSLVLPVHGFWTAALDGQLPSVGSGPGQVLTCSGRLMFPVRLHLANQVLLI